MKKLNHIARALAFVSIAAVMAGCKTASTQDQVTGSIPNDYRLRHPIAVRVNYPRMAAETGPCGLWPEDLGPTYDPVYWSNRPHWNHGCASQRNLAAQVANPADLVQPRAETPVLASRRATALEKYRKGEATATQYPDANKGKISDLGQ